MLNCGQAILALLIVNGLRSSGIIAALIAQLVIDEKFQPDVDQPGCERGTARQRNGGVYNLRHHLASGVLYLLAVRYARSCQTPRLATPLQEVQIYHLHSRLARNTLTVSVPIALLVVHEETVPLFQSNVDYKVLLIVGCYRR